MPLALGQAQGQGQGAPSNERAPVRVAGNEPAISMLPFVGKCVIALALLALNRLAFDHTHKYQGSTMERGNVVTFKEPTSDEINDRFVVVEMRGHRALVALMDSDFAIVPTFVYATDDLIRIA